MCKNIWKALLITDIPHEVGHKILKMIICKLSSNFRDGAVYIYNWQVTRMKLMDMWSNTEK